MNFGIDNLIEITFEKPEDFLKIRETLTRIGIASRREKKLIQSCHILHKRGRYYIVHFKELFALDGKPSTFSDNDKARRNMIALLLEEWGLLEIVKECEEQVENTTANMSQIKVIPFAEKNEWVLESKYNIGKGR
jgi:hypothetical protein